MARATSNRRPTPAAVGKRIATACRPSEAVRIMRTAFRHLDAGTLAKVATALNDEIKRR